MRRPFVLALAFGCAALAAAAVRTAVAMPVRTAHVEAELVAERTALTPGSPLTVALRLAMQRGWHTYWQNPGDSGLPTTLEWKLPAGLVAGPIQWPAPRMLPVGPLANYGYEGEVLLLSDIAAVPDFPNRRSVTLTARADWLVCKEICIPEGADLSLSLPVAASGEPDPRWAGSIAAARAALPRPLEGFGVAATGAGANVVVSLAARSGAADPGEVYFFPFAPGAIEPSAPQTLTLDGDAWKLMLPVASHRVGEFTRVAGVLTASKGFDGQHAATIDVPLAGSIAAGAALPPAAVLPLAPSAGASELSFGVALAFALIGGVLLNLMPCVFPVLSLKVLGFAVHGGGRVAMRIHGLAFAAGVIASFLLLAAALVALRATGQQLGWGFQLQSPAVITALAVLFFVLALNLSGVYEILRLVPSSLAGWNARNPYVNDALSGVLAVVVASPCSAPFMGVALGYALTASPQVTFSVFTALGLGMALPYLLLAFFPRWRTRLPRPGSWMLRLRQLLAFPLYATVLWLAWVLGAQVDNDAVLRLGAALLLLALALWAWQTLRTGGGRAWGVAALASFVAAMVLVRPGGEPPLNAAVPGTAKAAVEQPGGWQAYAPERVIELLRGGRPVFVEFTAAWCVTCQVNQRLVLDSDGVRQAFAQNDVALVRADWTRRDAAIGSALAALGRNGVPVYVLYRPGREPLLLPEVLQRSTIIDALAKL